MLLLKVKAILLLLNIRRGVLGLPFAVKFNASKNVTTRAVQQLQTLWKNIKLDLKKRNAEARRERFTTGGGPPPSKDQTDELADLLTGIIEDQQPLDGIPDDDHLDSGHEELNTNEEIILTLVEEPVHSDCAPSTSGMESQRKDAATTFQQRPKGCPSMKS
ncbi:hypothetical protein GJAV_G00116750 [Gymnothorax javanicus]|nr:hypothetical protein GJAV_G00116750 [Gymnothorax javanicus]